MCRSEYEEDLKTDVFTGNVVSLALFSTFQLTSYLCIDFSDCKCLWAYP